MIISEGINQGKLQSIVVGELKKAGLKHRLKKIILKNIKSNYTVFGAQLIKVPSCSVICCGSTLSVPIVVNEMSAVLRRNAHMEGLFRKAGSQSRQKDIKRLLDAGGCVSDGHHPIDVASVLKLYLRCLPEPLIGAEVQDLLLRCRITTGENALKPLLHILLLLPVLHVHLLHYIMELLNFIASRHKDNLMDSSNLAIVLAPSIMPLPATASTQRLEHHVSLIKLFIENARHIGILTEEIMAQLDDDSEVHIERRKKRRSGSINRVLNGLRKMVSGTVATPAVVRENGKTPILKSASKRKCDNHEGLSAKKKKEIKQTLQEKDLPFTPLKMKLQERKRLRLSLMDSRTPITNSDMSSNRHEISSSDDMLTSSEHLFSPHDTIDLSSENKQPEKDYVRISKQEYEEIKSRVSAIETRLSREFTDIIPQVEPLQQVQNVYQQTLEDVAMLGCPTSDNLARRLSKELKIRPSEHPKIIRSPSARKIGTLRRRSKENVTKLVRHRSWNISTHSGHNIDRFYPHVTLRRERTSTADSDLTAAKVKSSLSNGPNSSSDNCLNDSVNHKYQLRKRSSIVQEVDNNKNTGRPQTRRSFNTTFNATKDTDSLDSSGTSADARHYENIKPVRNKFTASSPSKSQPKWRSAAAFFMDKTGEIDSSSHSGRPSVNRLRNQNAGAVLAKARLFETSSDNSSNTEKVLNTGFARKPRLSGQYVAVRAYKPLATTNKVKETSAQPNVYRNLATVAPTRFHRNNTCHTKAAVESWRSNRVSPPKKVSPQKSRQPQQLTLKRPMCVTTRTNIASNDVRKVNSPMRGVHNISPRRRSPRQKH